MYEKEKLALSELVDNISKNIKYEFINSNNGYGYREIVLDLAWKPVIDRNNRLISREELEKALNDPRIKELLKTHMFKIEFPYDSTYNIAKMMTMNMDLNVGYIKSIDLDKRKATVMIKNDMYFSISYFEPVLCFNKLGSSEYIERPEGGYNRIYNIIIGKAGLMRRELSSYYNR